MYYLAFALALTCWRLLQFHANNVLEKFLVDHRGVVRYRYPDKWEPEEILDDIKVLMNES